MKLFDHPKTGLATIISYVLIFIFSISILSNVNAQSLDDNNKVEIKLDDGTTVIMFGVAPRIIPGNTVLSNKKTKDYYYLPTNLRLARKNDNNNTPQFLYLKFFNDRMSQKAKRQTGSLLHFILEWGLTKEQIADAEKELKKKVPGAKLLGPAEVFPAETESFRIISASVKDSEANNKVITSGGAPLLPGSKASVSAILDNTSSQLLAGSLEKTRSIGDLDVELMYKYYVKLPAVKAHIKIDWEQMDSIYTHDYARKTTSGRKRKRVNQQQVDSLFQEMRTTGTIQLIIDQGKQEGMTEDQKAMVRKVVEDYMQVFKDAFLNAVSNQLPDMPKNEEERYGPRLNTDSGGKNYEMDLKRWQVMKASISQTIDLNLRMEVPRSMSVLANLAEWYDQVQHNENCVSSQLIKSEESQFKDLTIKVGNITEKLLEDEINSVEIMVESLESVDGYKFTDNKTFSKHTLNQDLGTIVTFQPNERFKTFRYKINWNFAGFGTYGSSNWKKLDGRTADAAAPIVEREFTLEGDTEDLKSKNITRVTAEIRYRKFDKEHTALLYVSPGEAKTFDKNKIFFDADQQGYAYRLVLNHKTRGKILMDWVGLDVPLKDDYIFANSQLKGNFLQNGSTDDLTDILSEIGKLKESIRDLVRKK